MALVNAVAEQNLFMLNVSKCEVVLFSKHGSAVVLRREKGPCLQMKTAIIFTPFAHRLSLYGNELTRMNVNCSHTNSNSERTA